MMYRLSLCLLLLLCSCESNTIYEAPTDLIPKDSMVLLLTDMYTAISAKNIKNKFYIKNKSYMPLVYEKYKIDSVRFSSSNNYYTSNIEPYNEILDQVKQRITIQLDSLEKKVASLDSIKKYKRKRRDSINKIRRLIRKDSIKKWSKVYFYNLNKHFSDTSLITSEIGSKE